MTTLIFDTLAFADRAEKAGFTREQAEFQAREAANAIDTKIATKPELYSVRDDLIKEIKLLEHRMTIKFGAMMVAGVGILLAFKFFHIT